MDKIFDAHLHIIDPSFPLIENQGYLPESFSAAQYEIKVKQLNVIGDAVVSGSFQGYDQSYLTDALQRLGNGFVGVTQLPEETSEKEVVRLDAKGVKAVRVNVERGGGKEVDKLNTLARKVYAAAGWHTELYVSSSSLSELMPIIKKLPAVSIDHLGLTQEGFTDLLYLADKGVKVKATGFGRVNFNIKTALQKLYRVNPHCLMFGTDLPSTRAPRPFRFTDIRIVKEALGEKEAENVLFQNAARWYLQ